MEVWIIIVCVIAVAVLFCFLLAIANHSGERFMEKFEEMNNIPAQTPLEPREFINLIHKKYFHSNLEIVQISKLAGDAYSKKKLFLSADTLNRGSLASYTIIAHEMGHAKQDEEGKKLKRLNLLRKLGRLLGLFMMPSLLTGIILLFFENLFILGLGLISFSVLTFILALVIKLITISIEKDASKKAELFLKEIMPNKQFEKCVKFLNDARLTYWGEFLRVLFIWTGASRSGKIFN